LGWCFLLRRWICTAVCCGAASSRDSLHTKWCLVQGPNPHRQTISTRARVADAPRFHRAQVIPSPPAARAAASAADFFFVGCRTCGLLGEVASRPLHGIRRRRRPVHGGQYTRAPTPFERLARGKTHNNVETLLFFERNLVCRVSQSSDSSNRPHVIGRQRHYSAGTEEEIAWKQ
jgi:hypothetical protein